MQWECESRLCVLCLLLSVQIICSFSLKPTRSMRVICQVKYCSFLLFHLTLLHWGYDNISATSCQHPSGHLCSFAALSDHITLTLSFSYINAKNRRTWSQRIMIITCGENLLWLFGLDLVKMKSSPSVYVLFVKHACSYMLLLFSYISKKYDHFISSHDLRLIFKFGFYFCLIFFFIFMKSCYACWKTLYIWMTG